ncbi:MAG: T9SS type A sorting domain-containing protein, partial [Bacteroidales bacterium]|nr:T9SS type A sorting domain-containing protein [Bacteroidales bacterium]
NISSDLITGQSVKFNLINIRGQSIFAKEIQASGLFRKQLDLSEQPAGVYFLMLETGGKVIASEKLVVL